MDWVDLLKYPQELYKIARYAETLDTAQELIPISWNRDRTGTFIRWFSDIRDAGLITQKEYYAIQRIMIDGPGGF